MKDVGSASGFKCSIPLLGTELCGEALLDIEYAGALVGKVGSRREGGAGEPTLTPPAIPSPTPC